MLPTRQETALLHDRASQDTSFELEEDRFGDDDEASVAATACEKHQDADNQSSVRTLQYRSIGIGLIALLIIFGGGSFLASAFLPPPIDPAVPFFNFGMCGATPDEARSNGCVFDLMMSGWLHPACYEQDISDRFLRENNWTFYRERDGVNVLSEEEARRGEYKEIFTRGDFHYQHCAYIWAKQARAKTRFPLVLDSASRSEEHVQHCIGLVGNPNITKVPLATGTRLVRSTWHLQCMVGEKRVE